MKRVFAYIVMAMAILLVLPAMAQEIGPLLEISRPNAIGTCDDGVRLAGTTLTIDDAVEPFVAVNPVNRDNIVAAWWQGQIQNVIAGVSLDGGGTWQRVPIPLTVCSGGSFLGAGDERLVFASNGDLYAMAVVGNSLELGTEHMAVSKSTDGGLHWSAPVLMTGETEAPNDLPVLTADPTDARLVYAVWDGTSNSSGHIGPAVFARTTDGGFTWEPARPIVQADSNHFVQFSQILVLPDGALVDLYELVAQVLKHPVTQTSLQVQRSTDHGQTWSASSTAITMTPLYAPSGDTLVIDPKTGQLVQDPHSPSFAIDRRNGDLYAVWEDGRFANFQYNDIAFSMSADGGLTWSVPIRVNQTPLNIPPANRQSFLPTLAVAADGTIGVTYYDFRFNDPNPGLPTDYWLVQCHPSSTVDAGNPACWRSEVRLTDSSFNTEAAHLRFGGPFLGDYFGLTAAGDDFVAVFGQPDSDNVTSIFARRVGP